MGNILSQDEYHYNETWDKKSVGILIETLSNESSFGKGWDYPTKIAAGYKKAIKIMEKDCKKKFTVEEVAATTTKLHERFTVWKKLVSDNNVLHNKFNNRLTAPPSVWETLVKEDERVKCYANDGEELFDDLELIFDNKFKNTNDYVPLGAVTHTINTSALRFSDLEQPRMPAYHTPPRPHAAINLASLMGPFQTGVFNCGVFSPFPVASPVVKEISKDEFEASSPGKKPKSANKLFNNAHVSPISSVGSSTKSNDSAFMRIVEKWETWLELKRCATHQITTWLS